MLSKLTPIALAFFVIVIGYLIGKIKMYHITFDVSAILIVAAITGYILSRFSPATIDDAFINDMGLLSKLGTYIFVSSIGLFSGFSISKGFNRKNLVCFFIGSFMVCSGYISMKLISLFDTQMDQSLLFGILCGSLTSTPGLAAVCENKWITAEFATLGYGCSYLLGVISTVLFVQLMTMNTPEITNTSVENYRTTQKKSDIETLLLLGLSIVFGSLLGGKKLPFIEISLGASGGILSAAILIGYIIGKFRKTLNEEHISVFRNFGLMIFFAGVGIPAGVKLTNHLEIKWFIYGLIFALVPICFGYLLNRFVSNYDITSNMEVIAGGMTSTPAIGALLRKDFLTIDLSIYSFSYVGALLTIVILL